MAYFKCLILNLKLGKNFSIVLWVFINGKQSNSSLILILLKILCYSSLETFKFVFCFIHRHTFFAQYIKRVGICASKHEVCPFRTHIPLTQTLTRKSWFFMAFITFSSTLSFSWISWWVDEIWIILYINFVLFPMIIIFSSTYSII